MQILYLIILSLLSILFGILYVYFLTSHPLKMSRFLLGTCAAFFGSLVIIVAAFQGGQGWLAIGLAVVFAVIAYLLTAKKVLSREDPRQIPDFNPLER